MNHTNLYTTPRRNRRFAVRFDKAEIESIQRHAAKRFETASGLIRRSTLNTIREESTR